MRLCPLCGPGTQSYSVSVHGTDPKQNVFASSVVGDKIALRAINGYYMAVCYNCWPTSNHGTPAFFSAIDTTTAESLWFPVNLKNGNWVLQGSNGMYLTRCAGCVPNGRPIDFAFIHVASPDYG